MSTGNEGGRSARCEALREVMARLGLGAIVLRRPPNFAWYTGGGDNRVDHSAPSGVAEVVVTVDGEYVVTSSIEAARMREERTPDIEVMDYPWYEDPGALLHRLAGGNALGADVPIPDVVDVSEAVTPLRYVLDAEAIARYREVGADTAAAMAEAADALAPDTDEWEAAAALVAACLRRRLYTPVVMAAGRERLEGYRHPTLHSGRLGERAMLVVCAERGGLYANLTRFVHFEEPSGELRRRFEACERILQRMREKVTRPGRTLAQAFGDCTRLYADEGFPDEWRLLHQGGLTGYATREVVATPHTALEIRVGQAFAWNPSITGAKAEETFVLTESGPEVLTPRR